MNPLFSLRYLLVCFLVVNLFACSGELPRQSPAVSSGTAQLHRWLDERYEEELKWSPLTLTDLGRKEFYDQIDDFSEQAEDAFLHWRAGTVEDLKRRFDYAALEPDAKISYDLWVYRQQRAEAMQRFRRHAYVFTQMNDPHAWLPNFLINQHNVDTVDDMQAYIKRIEGVARAIEQLLHRARLAAADGIRPPKFAYENVIDVSKKLLDGAPFVPGADTPLWKDGNDKITALLDKGKIDRRRASRLQSDLELALLDKFRPAYESLINWAEEDIKNVDVIAHGVSELPQGRVWYDTLLKYVSGTELDADQVHQIGLSEVARIRSEMETIKSRVGFAGSLQEFFVYIRTAPQFLYPDTDAGRQAYLDDSRQMLEAMQKKLPDWFGRLPKSRLEVRRVEAFREQPGAAQHYFSGSPDGSRPGIYYVHLADMKSMPKNEMEAIAYHEGVPGHHLQVSIARELENVPKFRMADGSTSYTEGWALYAEYLSKEMGAYTDPYRDFGRLMTEMWRAIRLVVDTGIHAKGWTEDEAFQFFKANNPMAEGQIRSEIRRYFSTPAQANSYKIGMLKILELRQHAKSALGPRFDIRAFHDTVLGTGSVPMPILERAVQNWIQERLAVHQD